MNKIKYLTSLCILSLIVSGCAEKELPKFSDTNESVMQSSVYQKEDLEIYIPIEYINIPDLHNDIYTDPTELRRKCANKVIFDTKEFENYTIELVGNTVMRDTSIDSNIIFSYYLDIRLNYYDEKKDQTPAYANSVNMGQGAYKLVADKLDKYITLYEMHTSSGIYPLIIFQYFNESSIGETTFYSIIDEQLFFFIIHLMK